MLKLAILLSVYFFNSSFAAEQLREDFGNTESATNESSLIGNPEQCSCRLSVNDKDLKTSTNANQKQNDEVTIQ